MRLFHYPPEAPIPDDKAFGVAPHSDYGMITLLSQDPIGGLELLKRDSSPGVSLSTLDGLTVTEFKARVRDAIRSRR